MEAELDLRPYIVIILRRWKMLLGFALIATFIASALVVAEPSKFSSTANLLVVPDSNQVTFDSRFTTNEVSQVSTAALQRQGMLALATSSTLEALTRSSLPPELANEYSVPGSMLGAVQVQTDGDLVKIVATAGQEATSQALAESWAKSYQQLVNDLYNSDARLSDTVKAQLADAGQRYDEAQQNLEAFIAGSTLAELEQRITNLQNLLSNAANADQQLYIDYLKHVRDLDMVVADARTLRDQVADGQLDSLGNALALLSLRARAAGITELPFTLSFSDPAAIGAGTTVSVEDIDQLTAVLQQRRLELIDQTQGLARSLAVGDGDLIGLASQIRQRYIAELTELVRQQEAQQSQQRLLEQRRDIAFESLKLLQTKSDELEIARRSPQVEVRFISVSVNQPVSISRQLALSSVVGFGLGLFLGLVGVILFDILRPALRRLSATPVISGPIASQGEPKA
jgi:capsular polysaccharide biosynthesis protein